MRKSHASQWNNSERLRPELRGLIGFRPDFSGFRGPTNILILKFVQFQDKLIPNYISDSNFFPISVLRCAQFIIRICSNPEHRTLNKSIYPINPPSQNLSLRIAFLRMNIFTINKFSIEKKAEALIVYGIQRNKINPLSPEIPGESEGSGNGDGASITWRSRIGGQSTIYAKSPGNPTIGDDPRRARCRAPRNRRTATSRTRVNDRRVTAAWWTSPDQRFGIAVGLERNATLRGGLARLARSQPADQPTPCYAADVREEHDDRGQTKRQICASYCLTAPPILMPGSQAIYTLIEFPLKTPRRT